MDGGRKPKYSSERNMVHAHYYSVEERQAPQPFAFPYSASITQLISPHHGRQVAYSCLSDCAFWATPMMR